MLQSAAGYGQPNTYACAAAIMGQPALAQPMNDFMVCLLDECGSCDENDQNALNQCFMSAQSGACAAFANAANSAENALSAAQSQWETPCGADQGSLETAFAVATQTVCGP